MNTAFLICGALVGVASLLFLILWVIAIIKSFKGGNTGWGIVNILIGLGLINMIFFFIKGSKGLGILSLLAIIMMVGGVGFATKTMATDPEFKKQIEALIEQQAAPATQ